MEKSEDFQFECDGSIRIGDIFIPPPPTAVSGELYKKHTEENRLIITELHLYNFKSYAGIVKFGPFYKNFCSIIGPNGSGKSNVIDSLLFVFGYRSTKLRSKNVHALIHSSKAFPQLNECSVTVHFARIIEKGDNFTILPDTRFSVKRTAFRNSTTTYEICGKRAHINEVRDLLRKHKIDIDHNRFLILQGEIELISLMKPKAQNVNETGFLEYLEDICGSNRFVKPIAHFSELVQKLNDETKLLLNELKAIESEKDSLEDLKDEAIDYLRKQNEIKEKEHKVLQKQMKKEEKELDNATTVKDKLLEDMKTLNCKQKEQEQIRIGKQNENSSLNRKYESHLSAIESYKQEYNDLDLQDIQCRENINNSKTKMKKLIQALEAEETKLETLKKQLLVHNHESSELLLKKKKLFTQKTEQDTNLNEAMKNMKGDIMKLHGEKDKHESKLIKLRKEVLSSEAIVSIAQRNIDLELATQKREEKELERLKELNGETLVFIKEKEELLQTCKKEIPEIEQKLLKANRQMKELEEKEVNFSSEIKSQRVKVNDAKYALYETKGSSHLLKALMAQKLSGKIPGIYGRLGDLGSIDKKYDVAISTACATLDNIVTDTIETAQTCIEFMKSNNLGYATFIALDKMSMWWPNAKSKILTPENIPRLFDLVYVENESLLPAFYFALRDTLVADDLEQATRVGLGGQRRHRVVTLKGELIDMSGTMSGGGGKPLSGKMGESITNCDVSSEIVKALEVHLATLLDTLHGLQSDKDQLEGNIIKTSNDLKSFQNSMEKNELKLENYKKQITMIDEQIVTQRKKILESKPDEMKLNQFEKEIEAAQDAQMKISKDAAVVEAKVERLKETIFSVTKGSFHSAREKEAKLSKEIDKVTQAMTKTSVFIKTSERNVAKVEKKIAELRSEIKKVKDSTLEDLRKKRDEITEKAKKVLSNKEAEEGLAEECHKERKEMCKKIKEYETIECQLKSEAIKLGEKIKSADITVKKIGDQINSLKIKLSRLKLNVIDGECAELVNVPDEELETISEETLAKEIETLEMRLRRMTPDLSSIEKYKLKEEQHKVKSQELSTVTKKKDINQQHFDKLRELRITEFMKAFTIIGIKLKQTYQMLTLGGDADLEFKNHKDPFSDGIVFSVRPKGKAWKEISNLSGGEKTLSSLAFVFALQFYSPAPFYVMDEIDAALDINNVTIVASYIKRLLIDSQFIIISLRSNMFELAHQLFGVVKVNDCATSVPLSIKQQCNKVHVKRRESEVAKEVSKSVINKESYTGGIHIDHSVNSEVPLLDHIKDLKVSNSDVKSLEECDVPLHDAIKDLKVTASNDDSSDEDCLEGAISPLVNTEDNRLDSDSASDSAEAEDFDDGIESAMQLSNNVAVEDTDGVLSEILNDSAASLVEEFFDDSSGSPEDSSCTSSGSIENSCCSSSGNMEESSCSSSGNMEGSSCSSTGSIPGDISADETASKQSCTEHKNKSQRESQ